MNRSKPLYFVWRIARNMLNRPRFQNALSSSADAVRCAPAGGGCYAARQCLLCGETSALEVERIAFKKIWCSLTEDLMARFSKDVIDKHTLGDDTILFECQNCGLQYFVGAIPGHDDFYHEITTTLATYYTRDKWDFHEAARIISPSDAVLDIACGSGNFLGILRNAGCNAVGVDTNQVAVSEACTNGLSAYCVDLADYAISHGGCFDVVTAFQVIEHISEVQEFIRCAFACVKPGGKLILTVPNRLRRFRDAFEPLDCPPHHLSRWTSAQFAALAALAGGRIIDIRYEPMSMHDCRALLRNKIAGWAGHSESIWARVIARLVFPPGLYSIYLQKGLLDRWRLWRMSVMCVLEKAH